MRLRIEVQDAQVRQALRNVIAAGQDLTPAMRAVGRLLLRSTQKRFVDEEAPDGTPWAPLTEATRARKRKNVHRILTEYGHLSGQLNFREGRDFVEIGSSRIYASTHQFGALKGAFGTTSKGAPIPWGNIPARPFLGISAEDEINIRQEIVDFISEAWR